MQHHRHCEQHTPASLLSRCFEIPEFLVISLFALRLVKQLIQGLGPYPEREADMARICHVPRAVSIRACVGQYIGCESGGLHSHISGGRLENEDASAISHRLYAFESRPLNETTP
jgi:hypothetical protein